MDLEQLQQRNRELLILNTIAQELNREVALDKALSATLQQTVGLLNLETGWIWLVDPDQEDVYLAASHQLPPALKNYPERLTGWCYCIDKYLTGKLADVTNISEITCSRLEHLTEGTGGLRYHASVPLIAQEKKIGILNVVSKDQQELPAETLRLLYTIGDMLSIAVQRARLFEGSRRLGIAEERNRLAREIHDTLAQTLSALALRLEAAELVLESNKREKLDQLIQESLQLTRTGLAEARQSVLNLRAGPLQADTLSVALEKLLEKMFENEPMEIRFTRQGEERPASLRVEHGLYYIAREALQNSLKHAAAKEVSLQLHYHSEQLELIVFDNGKGFDPQQSDDESFGLVGISERVKLLGGRLEISSGPKEGTLLRVSIPIDS